MTGYPVLRSELIDDAPIIALRRDTILTSTGEAVREVVEHFGAVAVVAVQGERVLLVRQWRQPVGEYLWELPAGLLDHVGESPLAAAQRELAEEAQLCSHAWSLLGDIVTSPGFAEEKVRVFLAEDCAPLETPGEPGALEAEEADLERQWVDVDELRRWIAEGKILNSIALSGLHFWSLGVRRDPNTAWQWRSGLRDRRQGHPEGTDMKQVR